MPAERDADALTRTEEILVRVLTDAIMEDILASVAVEGTDLCRTGTDVQEGGRGQSMTAPGDNGLPPQFAFNSTS